MKKQRNLVNWRKGDYLRLEKAVSDFNAKINELQKEEKKAYLPNFVDISEIKKEIVTKSELTRYLNSLRRFSEKGAENIYTTEEGEKLTVWEKNEFKKSSEKVLKDLKEQMKPFETKDSSGHSLSTMGNSEYRTLKANYNRIKNFENLKGSSLKSLLNYVNKHASNDYTTRKATIYRNNYLQVIKDQFSALDGYKELLKAFNQHSNPIEFFEWISSTGNVNIIDIHYESDNVMTQEQFYEYLEQLGIEIPAKVG